MKTNVVMIRPMGQFTVQQRTKDGYFNATDLLTKWNEANKDKQRSLDNFWKATNLNEFMEEIVKDPANSISFTSVEFTDLKSVLTSTSKARGDRGGGTWMHPYLFVKFAMYLNPRFEYQVVKFVADNLIQFRKDSGDAYRKMCDSLYPKFPSQQAFTDFIVKNAMLIKQACGVKSWEEASEAQLEKRKKIELVAVILSDLVPAKDIVPLAIAKA